MKADPRVIELAKKHGCVFYPNQIIARYKEVKGCFRSINVVHIIAYEALKRGDSQISISLKQLQDAVQVKTKKTLTKYLNFLNDKKLIIIKNTKDPQIKIIELNPRKFGPVFPTYEEALDVVEGRA